MIIVPWVREGLRHLAGCVLVDTSLDHYLGIEDPSRLASIFQARFSLSPRSTPHSGHVSHNYHVCPTLPSCIYGRHHLISPLLTHFPASAHAFFFHLHCLPL